MSDDTISRQEAVNAIRKEIMAYRLSLESQSLKHEEKEMFRNRKSQAIEDIVTIERLPSAVPRGRWEHYEHREPQYDIMGIKTWAEAYKCSNCGFIHSVIEDFGHYSFCPNCGAKMDEMEE